MTTEFWITQTFNGLSHGALLFLLAGELSLIFGVMRIVNLAAVADRVHVLSRGEIVYSGTPAELMADETVKSRYLGVA